MSIYHFQLLIQKSVRYAWRRRTCRYCPKIIFELFIPAICIFLLYIFRWINTPSSKTNIQTSSSIIPQVESIEIFNYTSVYRCPPSNTPIEILGNDTYNHFKRICPRSHFILSSSSSSEQYLFLNTTSKTHGITYHCQYNTRHWCEKINILQLDQDALQIQHPSSFLCSSNQNFQEFHSLLKSYLSIESLLNRPLRKKIQLLVYTYPCSSYLSDKIFEVLPRFTLILILILLDGSILFSFNYLFQELIDEKQQGIIELLRLLSIQPLLNSLAWFLRTFSLQFILNIFLILILKTYFSYLSIWLVILTILLWTIQVLSRSILVAHFFRSNLKASLWSWLIYFISFWLAVSSFVRLPMFIHLIVSAWLPFYSIKRILIIFIQINMDLGRGKNLIYETIFIWLSMIIGSLFMWVLAFYFEKIRPGKYGISRPWSWPLDYIRKRQKQKRRTSIDKNILETSSNDQTTVEVNNLTKTYGRFNSERHIAVDHISFTLENSRIHGLIGHNGAGKTTTMEMICGILSCDNGRIEIHKKNLFENLHELQPLIGYCPQQDMLFSYLTVQEQLEFYASVRSKDKHKNYQQIQDLLNMMDMNKYNQKLCHTLSGGMKRKLSILCAFVGNVDVIILDEPSSSLDPVARRILWSWLREYKQNRTLLISSHLLDEVEELCDSIIILDSGKIIAQGTILDLKRQFNPLGDRIYLEKIPEYIPKESINNENNHYVQISDRKKLIKILEQLEKDQIKYSLNNITLDEIFSKLTSESDLLLQNENDTQSQINQLFIPQINTHLWSQQMLAVLIRRCQVFIKQAHLLVIVIILYLIYALSPLYIPSFTPSFERIHHIISSSHEYTDQLNLKSFETKFVPSFNSSEEFQEYLLKLPIWISNHQSQRKLVALRITSPSQFECYIPSPMVSNIITSCLPIFSLFSNRTISPLQLIGDRERKSSLISLTESKVQDNSIFCFSMLPPTYHLSIILISFILIICSAFVIQDYNSGLYSYSLIHGLHSSVHWCITFLSDFILCLLWLLILILIEYFIHYSIFNIQFFLLTPLFFLVNLPFIYLIGKFFQSPIIGATGIIFLLQLVHILYTFKIFFEIFRNYPIFTKFLPLIRWIFIILFPNINVFILIQAILKKSLCPFKDFIFEQDENYSNKILIHTSIFLIQFFVYFILLIIIDITKLRFSLCKIKNKAKQQKEDDDVEEERSRIQSMNDQDKQNQALIVENLSKYFHRSDKPVVDRLTFAVPHGQCFGLLGFNGSGKTTTFRMLVGELTSSDGDIYKTNQKSIGYCPQNDITFSGLTVLQTINYMCRLRGINPLLLNQIILTQFQLEKYRHYLISNLSGGTQRRLHLALCLIGSPTLLLLDEPTAKVDPLLRRHIRLILQHRPINTTIIFASHSMIECEQLCDRLTILVHGQAKCLGTPEHLKTKYGINYRIQLTLLQPTFQISSLIHIDNSNEYLYSDENLAELFRILEELVETNVIAPNYTVQLTSLEHIFLSLQHSIEIKV